MTNFTGGLLSYTAVHGCCNCHVAPPAAVCCAQLLGLRHTRGQKVLARAVTAAPQPWWGGGHSLLLLATGAPRWEQSENSACPICFSSPKTASLVCVSSSPFTVAHSVRVPLGFGLGTSMFWVQFLQRHFSFVLVFLCPHLFPWYLSLDNYSVQAAGCPQLAGRQLCNSEACSKKNECQQRWHPVFLLVSFLPKAVVIQWVAAACFLSAEHGNLATVCFRQPACLFRLWDTPHCNLLFQYIYWFCDSEYLHLILQVRCFPPCAVIS